MENQKENFKNEKLEASDLAKVTEENLEWNQIFDQPNWWKKIALDED